MSLSEANDAKERVRQMVDIVDLLGGSIDLRRQGANYVGLCPWHDDSKPSLQVNPQRQSWKCWVCDIGGDIFAWTMRREGVNFRQALEMLAEQAGVELPRHGPIKKVEPGSPDDKSILYKAMGWAVEQYHRCLVEEDSSEGVRQYLLDRGIVEKSIQQFQIGFAPDNWQWILDRAKPTPFTPAVLEACGLVGKTKSGRAYDRFKGRVLFPVCDLEQRPIALGGRILPSLADEKAAKYINSPETLLFEKRKNLYGLDRCREVVRKSKQVIVLEGYTDVVMASQHGVENTVAVLGTALTSHHVKLLRRFADEILLVLDGDEAGQRRTNEILDLFVAEQVDLRISTLPEGLDPCDFFLQQGAEAFRESLTHAVDALDHKVQVSLQGIDPVAEPHRANQALEEILLTVSKAPANVQLRQQQLLAKLARQFVVDESELRGRLTAMRRRASSSRSETKPMEGTLPKLDPWSVEVFELMTQQPEAAARILDEISSTEMAEGPARVLFDVYREIVNEGIIPEVQRVVTRLEDPQLKHLLFELEEMAEAKELPDPELRLCDLLEAFRLRRRQREGRRQVAALQQGHYDEEEQARVLERLIAEKRSQQGLSEPTEG